MIRRLLANISVRAAIQAAREKLSQETKTDAVWVERNLVEVVERRLQHQPVLDCEDNPTGTYRVDSTGANRALELLRRRFRMSTKKTNPPLSIITISSSSNPLNRSGASLRRWKPTLHGPMNPRMSPNHLNFLMRD
jgi:hypothetical protein